MQKENILQRYEPLLCSGVSMGSLPSYRRCCKCEDRVGLVFYNNTILLKQNVLI